MDARDLRRREICEAALDDPRTAGLIDGYYTDFDVSEDDRSCLDRFLASPLTEVRREALIALIFSTGRGGPKFTGYAPDAVALHILGLVDDSEAQYTAVSALHELALRGDNEAMRILNSLKTNEVWCRKFQEPTR